MINLKIYFYFPPRYKITQQKLLFFTIHFVNFVTSNVTIMNTRLKQFLAAENISQSQFADTIKVVRASVSHVLAGRNNPSYDFIKAIMDNYPGLNIEWLILGKGKMYKETTPVQTQTQSPTYDLIDEPGLFAYEEEDSLVEIPSPVTSTPENTESSIDINAQSKITQQNIKQRVVSKIIILYDDGSFQEM